MTEAEAINRLELMKEDHRMASYLLAAQGKPTHHEDNCLAALEIVVAMALARKE